MFDSTVFSFGIFTDKDGVDIVIRGFVTGDRNTGTDISKEIERAAKSEVERHMAFSYRGLLLHQPLILLFSKSSGGEVYS